MDDINFACTTCGQCCHDLRLPLSIAEAIDWLKRGGQLEFLCEAIPWPVEPEPNNAQAAYKRARSSAAMSGTLPVRVSIILTAAFAGACPNLRADMLCGIYDERPLVCRIYPAEINPFVPLVPKNKACPPEAWQTKPLQQQGVLLDATTCQLVRQSRLANQSEAPLRMRICRELGLDHAALANEGFVIHTPDREPLLAALEQCCASPLPDDESAQWTFVSNRPTTMETLASVGAVGCPDQSTADKTFRYRGFFPSSLGNGQMSVDKR
ncbi:YkgJ family cysteine cluster protein [Paraburkholderia sp. GAS334]|uniref:YkgJ family cysteine cluster protein n=1 Tax=Paraburkholderia sp. GAS334 TaxID=3035131 RepID=UPI003D2377E7